MYEAKYGVPKDVQVVASEPQEPDIIKLNKIAKELINKSSSKTNGVKFDDAKPKWYLVNLSLVREALELKRKDDIDGDIKRHYEDLVQLCSYYSKEGNDLSWSYVLFGRVLQLIIDVESNQ